MDWLLQFKNNDIKNKEKEMALIKCPECGKEISDKSKQCIHCGYPLDELKMNNNLNYIMFLFHIIIASSLLSS